ncbi:glutaredoxin family protein [Pseudalkalibacillus caeni]|uniref:glutaredoxin family protein n=1 Tax=Exobacillus caeni TaxID=2574798 RepID=UPI0026D3EA3A
MEPINVILYSKENCSLCDKAKVVLDELNEEIPLSVKEVDIYKDDDLLEKYMVMIPVVEIYGEEVDYGIISKEKIRKRLL